ncbi:hypothetical protein MBLNU459_g4007t1 [Dothideomycetes sp. NU459]
MDTTTLSAQSSANKSSSTIDPPVEDMSLPVSQVDHRDESDRARLNTMCQALTQDLKCLQMVYVFEPRHLDRDIVRDHLHKIAQDFVYIRDQRDNFPSQVEFVHFCTSAMALIEETTEIIEALHHREDTLINAQEETLKEVAKEAHPRYKNDLPPWSQFVAKGAPALHLAHFLAPLPHRVPMVPEYPLTRRVKATSVQALPPATTTILATWTLEFKKAIDYYHQRHPEDPEFTGPLQKKLVQEHSSYFTQAGLQVESSRIHILGNHIHAEVSLGHDLQN